MGTEADVAQLRTHAQAHYGEGGWSVVIEAWDDEDCARAIGDARDDGAKTMGDVISILGKSLADAYSVLLERKSGIRAYLWPAGASTCA